MKIAKYIIIAACVIAACITAGLILTGCNTFDVITIENQPDECNDFYTVMNYYSALGKGDAAFVGTVYAECKTARVDERKKLREKHCKDIIFGKDALLDKTQYQKYTHYLECAK